MNEKYKKNILEEITLQSTKEILCTSMEECCELAQAISKYICDFNEKSENLLIKENIAKEMAHVQICMEKVKEICGISDESVEEWIEEKTATSKRQILNRMKKNSRQINICKQDIHVAALKVYNSGVTHIDAIYDMDFTVDQYFGTKTQENSDVCLNFYTKWYKRQDGAVKFIGWLVVESPKVKIEFPWSLTPEEKEFFLDAMEKVAQEQCGKTLDELLKDTN